MRPSTTPQRRVALLAAYLAAAVVLTLAHPFNSDEGQVLTGAWNLYNGAEIYRDFFEFIGPATFAWVHLFFELLGPSYGAALVASWALLFVGLLAFAGSARLLSSRTAVIVVAAVVWLFLATEIPFVNHNTYSSCLAVVFAYFCLQFLKDQRPWMMAVAGAVAGAVFFVLQPKGAVLIALGLAVGATSRSRRALLGFVAAAAVVLSAGFAVWGAGPITSLLVIASVLVQMNHGAIIYASVLVAVALATVAAAALHHIGRLDRTAGFLLLLQAALWLSTAHLPDAWHLMVNGFPLVLLYVPIGDHWMQGAPRRVRHAAAFALAASLLIGASDAIRDNIERTRSTDRWLSEVELRVGGDSFFAFTFLPSFYLELQTPNPYYNSVLYESSHPAEHFRRNVELLTLHEPDHVLADYSTVAKYGHQKNNPVDDYLREFYELAEVIRSSSGRLEIWSRRDQFSRHAGPVVSAPKAAP